MHSASFSDRLKAATIDGVLLVGWIVLVGLLRPWPEQLPGLAKALVWFGVPLLAEPLYIFASGSTPGQAVRHLRVIRTSGQPLTLPWLLARHGSKALFLGASVFYILFSPRQQALHDHLFGSSVVYRDPEHPPDERASLRHPLRAFLVSFAISAVVGFAATVAVALVVGIVLEIWGLPVPDTGPGASLLELFLLSAYLFAQFRVLRRGTQGRLPFTGGVIAPAA